MEYANQCGWSTVGCAVSVKGCNEKTDLVLGNLPLPVDETDCTLSSIERFFAYCEGDIQEQEELCDIEEFCMSLLEDYENSNLFGMSWEQIEMFAILETIVKCNYNCTRAGRKLGICEKTLFNKLRKYRYRYYRDEL